ncbi:MAG: radical SAM protein, partial [bacterium]|nr:radical SAM protein [bacterium]
PVITAQRPPVADINSLPIPDRSLVNYKIYNKYIGLSLFKNGITIQATRGCPYDCTYCFKIWPKRHVARSAENLFAEIQLYYNMGYRKFSFIDDIFNLKIENSKRFFQLIIDNGLRVQLLFPAGLRGDILTEEYIDLMVEAGTINMALALETASPRMQKLIKKHLDIDKLEKNLRYICEKHPQVILDIFTMHGLPTETEEEALETMNFVKKLKWIHFPLINITRIYTDTDMEAVALESGITQKAITESEALAWHELPTTLPFENNFTIKYQTDFINEYFLNKERLLHVLPYQMKVLTGAELLQKYNSYLFLQIKTIDELLEFLNVTKEELKIDKCLEEKEFTVPYGEDKKTAATRKHTRKEEPPLKILLLDLSQFFSIERDQLYDLIEAPLGLMYLLTYLNREFGEKIEGKIAKSQVEFND